MWLCKVSSLYNHAHEGYIYFYVYIYIWFVLSEYFSTSITSMYNWRTFHKPRSSILNACVSCSRGNTSEVDFHRQGPSSSLSLNREGVAWTTLVSQMQTGFEWISIAKYTLSQPQRPALAALWNIFTRTLQEWMRNVLLEIIYCEDFCSGTTHQNCKSMRRFVIHSYKGLAFLG